MPVFNFFLQNGANPNAPLPNDCELLLSFNLRFQDKLYRGTTPLQFILMILCEENHFTDADMHRSKSQKTAEDLETFEAGKRSFRVLFEMASTLLDIRTVDVRLKDTKGTSPLSMIPYLMAVNIKYSGPEMSILADKLRSRVK